jgi:hypothetical protein
VKTILALLLALAFGCSRPPESETAPRQPITKPMIAIFGEAQFGLLTNALALATNKDDVLPVLAGEMETGIIAVLSHCGPAELNSELDRTKLPGAPYTRKEVIAAMKLHNSYSRTKKVELPESE